MEFAVPKILAPAGGRQQFFAALNAGADAVFLGLKQFNARGRAENFTIEDLAELMPVARKHAMDVLVTVNVLIKQRELGQLKHFLGQLADLGVTAIIVQDQAVTKIAREHFPTLRLHASTQMAIHNAAGVAAARDLGFSRVVVARELTGLEIAKIRKAVPDVELEAFCHGSLCYSYSGLCFFSGADDARSGNRGECAYTCRQPYKIVSEVDRGRTEYLFSMRDLDTSRSLSHLVRAGVHTLKIEGRKKDAQYVATAVQIYRKSLDEMFGHSTLRPEAPQGANLIVDPETDRNFAYQRQTTSFFLNGRYVENVIDLKNPTHSGVVIGAIEKIVEKKEGDRVLVKPACALERFDGLRVEAATELSDRYHNRHPETSIKNMYDFSGRWIAQSKVGDKVWLELGGVGEVGDTLVKTRSADLKRRVERMSEPPLDTRLRPHWPLNIKLQVTPTADSCTLKLTAAKLSRPSLPVAVTELTIPLVNADQPEKALADFRSTFEVLGDAGYYALSTSWEGPENVFVQRSSWKTLKRQLVAELMATNTEQPDETAPGLPIVAATSRNLVLKTDQIELLHGDLSLYSEVIFEPRRLAAAEIKSVAAQLARLAVPVRLSLPNVIRAWDEPVLRKLVETVALTRFEVGNLGGFELLREWLGKDWRSFDVAGDFSLYALSSEATKFWLNYGVTSLALSVEDDANNLAAHLSALTVDERAKIRAILYKDTPLFLAEACSLTALHDGCPTSKVCGYRTLEIENEKGERFYVAHEGCKSVVYGKNAYSITDQCAKLSQLSISTFRIDCITRPYSDDDVKRISQAAATSKGLGGTHSANFHRELL